jgi:hypothetical protein
MLYLIFGFDSGSHWFNVAAEICTGALVCAIVAFLVWWFVESIGVVGNHRGDDGFAPIGVKVKDTEPIKRFDKTNTTNRSTSSHRA